MAGVGVKLRIFANFPDCKRRLTPGKQYLLDITAPKS